MNEKKNGLVILCYWIFSLSLLISVVTTFKACPFSPGNQFDKMATWEYFHNLSIGLLCSTVLVLFVEKYHHKKDIETKEHNRIILLKALVESINKNYTNTFKRSAIIHLYSGIEYGFDDDIYTEHIRLERRFLTENNGRWTYGKFIFVNKDIYEKLLVLNATQEKYQTEDIKQHLILVKLYLDSLYNIKNIRKTISLEQLGIYKVAEVLSEDEHDALKNLYIKIDDLFAYLNSRNSSTRESINKYNIVQEELLNTYNSFIAAEDR